MNQQRAVFLDRDGTLVVDHGFVYRVEDLALLPGVVDGLRRMAALGFQLVVATNQSGVARGLFSEAQMQAFNAALCQRLADAGVKIAAVYACVFHPTEGNGRYRLDSPLRKPRPGMLLAAAADHDIDLEASFAIGDRPRDVAAGRAAGCRTILLSAHGAAAAAAQADFVAADLVEAAACIEQCLDREKDREKGTGTFSRRNDLRPLFSHDRGLRTGRREPWP